MNVQTLADSGDARFRWVLGSFMLLLLPFQAVVVLSPRVESAEAELVDRASALVVGVIRLPPPTAIVLPRPPAPKPALPAPLPAAGPVAGAPAPSAPVGSDPLITRVVGTHGLGHPEVDDILAFDAVDAERLARALDTVTGAEIASRAPPTLRAAAGPPGPDAAVALTVAEAGGATIGEGAAVAVAAPKVDAQAGEVQAEAGDIARVLGARKGAVESCTQAALKKDPATRGRIGVAWRIQGGRVVGSALTASVEEWAWVVSGG